MNIKQILADVGVLANIKKIAGKDACNGSREGCLQRLQHQQKMRTNFKSVRI